MRVPVPAPRLVAPLPAAAGSAVALSSLLPWRTVSGAEFSSTMWGTPWRTSGLWIAAVACGIIAALLALLALRTPTPRRNLLAAGAVAAVGAALVLWGWGSVPCRCGAPAAEAEIGWYVYGHVDTSGTLPSPSDTWVRAAAAGLLAAQAALLVAAARFSRAR